MSRISILYIYLLNFFIIIILSGYLGIIDSLPLLYYNTHRQMQFTLFALLPLVVFFRPTIIPVSSFVITSILLLFLIGLLSGLLSGDIVKSLTGTWQLSAIIISILVVSISCNEKTIKIITYSIIAALSVYVFYYFIQVILDIFSQHQEKIYMRFVHGFDNPRFLNQIQTCIIPLAILSTLLLRNKKSNHIASQPYLLIFTSTVCCLYISILFLTGGRGAIMSHFSALVITWLICNKKLNVMGIPTIKYWIIGYLIYLLTLLATGQLFSNIDSPPYSTLLRFSSSGRLEIWSNAIEFIKDSPWLGAGPLMYSMLSETINHPHNSILWLMSEWGIPGTIAVISLMIYMYVKYTTVIRLASRQLDANNSSLLISFTVLYAITAAGIHSLISGIYIVPASQMICTLLLIFAVSNYHSLQKQLNITHRQTIVFAPFSKIMITAYLSLLLIPTITYHDRTEWGKITGDKGASPEYWIDGNL